MSKNILKFKKVRRLLTWRLLQLGFNKFEKSLEFGHYLVDFSKVLI